MAEKTKVQTLWASFPPRTLGENWLPDYLFEGKEENYA
jgi:hypothetical protein